MAYIVKVNNHIVGIKVLTTEEVKKYNNNKDITLVRVDR